MAREASTSKYNLNRVATSAGIATNAHRILGLILVGGSADSTVKIYDNTSATGTEVFGLAALTGCTTGVDLREFGGINVSTGIYVSLSGTGAVAYVWWG